MEIFSRRKKIPGRGEELCSFNFFLSHQLIQVLPIILRHQPKGAQQGGAEVVEVGVVVVGISDFGLVANVPRGTAREFGAEEKDAGK